MMKTGIGQAVPRREDFRLLTGGGRYSDDVNMPSQAYAAVVRSPHAHAAIADIDLADALAVTGVIAALTGRDAVADGLQPIPHNPSPTSPPDIQLLNRDGSDKFIAPHPVLAIHRVRFVGEAVAFVVAESRNAALDGASAVHVDYEPLPHVTATRDAAEDKAPRLWDEARSNVSIDADVGDRAATDAAFAEAVHVVRLDTWIDRVTGVPLEPRAVVAAYDPETSRYTVHAGGGGIVRPKRELAAVLDVPLDKVRVLADDVGGNFGTRNAFYPEVALLAWAARRTGRPVKWTADRNEAFLSDYQGRDLAVSAELALDADGRFLALRGSNISNTGAHTVSFVPLTKGVELMSGVYAIPTAYFRARATLSNTPPTNPYRSAGRPEVIFAMERLVDLAARQCGFDRIELRRRNLISPGEMPFANPLGLTYDSGAYEDAMDRVLAEADWDGYLARKAESAGRGRHRGLGIACYVETSTGAPRERTEMTVRPNGCLDVVIGTLSSGQGHETSFAQLASEWLGVPLDSVRLITGDTDIVSVGGGSHSGRSMRLAGIVMGIASDEIIATGRRIAAHVLEASEQDISFGDGRFAVVGTDRSIGLFETAAAALERADLPDDLRGPLTGISDETVPVAAYPYGCHVCEVEVDGDTGEVEIVRYTALDDVGRAINPLILHGQAHGGIVQGLGQALLERCHYDGETGQLLSASFMDYAIPRADHVPSFATLIGEVPSTTNRLGIRAGGEGGTTPALAVAINAIVDALDEFGIEHIEMPATPEAIWRAIHTARRATG